MPAGSGAVRTAEGTRPGNGARVAKPRGRPVGSKNKPKSLVPTELANELLLKMQPLVPPEHFAYLKGVIKDGKAVATKSELDTLILLLSRNLYPALVAEMKTKEGGAEGKPEDDSDDADVGHKYDGPVFRKDVTERLKVLNSLLSLRSQIERREDDAKDETPVLKLFASRGMAARIAVLVQEEQPRLVSGVEDGSEPVDGTATPVGPSRVARAVA